MLGKERSIVSDIAGTTRDAVDSVIYRQNSPHSNDDKRSKAYRIIDTAGIRRQGKVDHGSEFFMVNRAFKAIRRADVVVLMLDAQHGVVYQDRVLAERVESEGRACVICMNKWDVVVEKDDSTFLKAVQHIRDQLPNLKWAEVSCAGAYWIYKLKCTE